MKTSDTSQSTMERKGKVMARPQMSDWEEGDNLILLEGWARSGLTDEQIAHNIGIARSTLSLWRSKSSVIDDTLKKTKEVVDRMVENALFEAAMSGNTTAQIFWLKNRRTKEWRDKVEQELSHEIKVSMPEQVEDYGD